MNDLISRKQAIAMCRKPCMRNADCSDFEMEIMMLPSAQPEIIRCKDCDWWTKQEDNPRGRCALFQIYSTGGWFCGSARRER